jgi:hypothetical protein
MLPWPDWDECKTSFADSRGDARLSSPYTVPVSLVGGGVTSASIALVGVVRIASVTPKHASRLVDA